MRMEFILKPMFIWIYSPEERHKKKDHQALCVIFVIILEDVMDKKDPKKWLNKIGIHFKSWS